MPPPDAIARMRASMAGMSSQVVNGTLNAASPLNAITATSSSGDSARMALIAASAAICC